MVTTPIRKKSDIERMKNYFLSVHEYRNYTSFVVGINTALRISDLLNLRWKDIYNWDTQKYRSHISLIEQKTKKMTYIAINKNCLSAFRLLKKHCCPKCGDEYIFFSGNDRYRKISRNRAYHIIKKAADLMKIEGNISCHSLRKTFGYHAWKSGVPPTLIMNIYNHSSLEITKRYLSIIQDDKDELFWKINL